MPGPRGTQAQPARLRRAGSPLLSAGLRFACHLSAPAPQSARLRAEGRRAAAGPRPFPGAASAASSRWGGGPRWSRAATPPPHPRGRLQGPSQPGPRGRTALRSARGCPRLPLRAAGRVPGRPGGCGLEQGPGLPPAPACGAQNMAAGGGGLKTWQLVAGGCKHGCRRQGSGTREGALGAAGRAAGTSAV